MLGWGIAGRPSGVRIYLKEVAAVRMPADAMSRRAEGIEMSHLVITLRYRVENPPQ